MSLSVEQLLEIRKALAAKIALAGILCLPTAIKFSGREDFWANVDSTKDTKNEIEMTPIVACWIRFLRFEDVADNPNADADESDSPITTRIYELTLFRSENRMRLDESDTPDAFKKRLLKTDVEIESDIENLTTEFRGIQPIEALSDEIFSVKETVSLAQNEFIEHGAECEFIDGVRGSQVKLECRAKIQLVRC